MQFVSIGFVILLALTVLLVRLAPSDLRSSVLLVSSYVFYFLWSWKMAGLLLVATIVGYAAALLMRKQRRPWVSRGMIACAATSFLVLVLAAFKSLPLLHLKPNIFVPLGISYYTFKLVSYLLDVYWGKFEPITDFVSFAAYVSFFPQVVAGPIQRASSFIPQLTAKGPVRSRTVEGLLRMAVGLGKKVVVADNLGLLVGWAYGHMSSSSSLPAITALYLYPLQLYADFSGLADIAIGAGLLLGIETPENFNAPFVAKNITEFWRRWHITLTSWVRDYVFMPMRAITRDWGKLGLAFSLTVNMILIGLWHGMTMGFLYYGLFHAAFLIFEALTNAKRQKFYLAHARLSKAAGALGPVFVFNVVAVGCLFFRAPSFQSIGLVLQGFTAGLRSVPEALAVMLQPPNHHAWIALPAFALLALADVYRGRVGFSTPQLAPRAAKWSVYGSVTTLWLLIVMALLATEKGADPFVYGLF